MKTASVRSQLLRWLLPLLLLLALVDSAVELTIASRQLRQAYDDALGGAAISIAERVHAEDTGKLTLLSTGAPLLTPPGVRRGFYALEADGSPIAGDLPMELISSSNDPALLFRDANAYGRTWRLAVHRTKVSGHAVIVAVAETTGERTAAWRKLFASMIVNDMLQLALVAFVVWFGVQHGLRSLLRVRDAVATRSTFDFAPIDETEAPAEARPLIEATNRALARAHEAIEARRSFIADAAHQLRKPLTVLHAGLVRLAGRLDDETERAHAQSLLGDSRRLARTTQQLLALAQAETAADVPRRRFDLRPMVIEQVERYFDRAIAREADLGVEADRALIEASPWLVREAIANLIDNALTHTPTDTCITVRCGLREGRPFLEVEDDGPGIPTEERDIVRQRFARSQRETSADGNGLGLAIVEQAAKASSGSFLIAAGRGEQGTVCRLEFPPLLDQ